MRLTADQQAVIRAFSARCPLVPGEENCRAWTGRLAAQMAFAFGPEWGHKRAGVGRPLSKDAIAYQGAAGFWGFDVISGAGTPSPALVVPDGDGINLVGQVFVPVVPVDYLGGAVPTPTPPEPNPVPSPDSPAPTVDLGPLTHAVEVLSLAVADLRVTVAGLRAELDATKDELAALHNRVEALTPHPWPTQTSRTWGHAHTVGG